MTFPEPEFERLFVANYDQLVRSLTVITGDREMARDCVQDAFVKAAARWRKVRRLDNPVTWIRRVAINRSRDVHRAEGRRRRRERRVSGDGAPVVEDRTGLVAESLNLVDLLEGLPARQRTVAALFYIEDLSVADIAAAIDISPGAVKFHLNKARNTLRMTLEEQEQHHG